MKYLQFTTFFVLNKRPYECQRKRETTKRRYFLLTFLREPVVRYLSKFRYVQMGAYGKQIPIDVWVDKLMPLMLYTFLGRIFTVWIYEFFTFSYYGYRQNKCKMIVFIFHNVRINTSVIRNLSSRKSVNIDCRRLK